ncbi:MAG: hypothetical protein ACREE6_11390 [Limisphaerales bacterium]
MRITLNISPIVVRLLATLDKNGDAKAVINRLIDHAQQGVYRPGAWEREWLAQAFGGDFMNRLEPGDPYGRGGCESVFNKPTEAER